MTDQEQKELRSYCAFILKEYGFQFPPNDPVIPALYIFHKEMQLNNQNNNAIASLVKEASARINPTVFHFNSPGEAWKFQMGVTLRWIISGLVVLLFVWAAIWSWSIANDVDRAKTIIGASDNLSELVKRVQKTHDGYYFIDFSVAKKDSIQNFKEFQKLNSKTVRVYLGKQSK